MNSIKIVYIGDSMYSIKPKESRSSPWVKFSTNCEIIGQVKIFRPDGTLKKIIKGKALEKHKKMIFEERVYPEDQYNSSIKARPAK